MITYIDALKLYNNTQEKWQIPNKETKKEPKPKKQSKQ